MTPLPPDPRPSSTPESFSSHRPHKKNSPNDTSPVGSTNAAIRLGDLALTRSGDKGNHVNLGVVALSRENYDFLVATLTEARIAEYFANCRPTKVERYLLPRVWSLNFLLYNALEGGASQSLRLDSQGKLFGVTAAELRLPPHHASKSQEPDT
jgi:hypothetical protein